MTNDPELVEMSEAHLVDLCNVSPSTTRLWCKILSHDELKALDYNCS